MGWTRHYLSEFVQQTGQAATPAGGFTHVDKLHTTRVPACKCVSVNQSGKFITFISNECVDHEHLLLHVLSQERLLISISVCTDSIQWPFPKKF